MWYVIGVVVLLALYFRFKLSFDQYKEASNVVTAAYTFGKLPREAQEAVRDRTRQILSKSGWRGEFSQLEENEPALYGWYALAMAELGISPNGVLDTWNYVRNPFNVDPKSKQYAIALKQFKKKTGGEIYIDPVNHRLNGSTSVLAKRKFAKAKADAEELGKAIAPFIDVIGQFALPELKENVKSWSLSNRTLINYLGYVAGVIDAEYQSGLGKSSTDDWTATEIVFRQIVEAQLDWIPECKECFLEPKRIGMELGGSAIGGMQRLPGFYEAMKLGGEDFLAAGTPGFFPSGLHKLGLFSLVITGKDDPVEEPVPEDYPVAEDYLSEEHIFDRSQDHKLSDIDFFQKECLYQIYGHCIVKDRNILPSDIVVIGTRFINVVSSAEEASRWGSPDEMIVSCSEPIIARCLTKSDEIDFDNCSEIVDNIGKYLFFSRGNDEAMCLFKLIRMENVVYPALSDEKDDQYEYFLATRELRQQVQEAMKHVKEIDMQYVERKEVEGW